MKSNITVISNIYLLGFGLVVIKPAFCIIKKKITRGISCFTLHTATFSCSLLTSGHFIYLYHFIYFFTLDALPGPTPRDLCPLLGLNHRSLACKSYN